MKNYLTPVIVGAAALGYAGKSDAATMTQYAPEASNPTYVALNMEVTNNDSGATYGSFELNNLRPLAQELSALIQNTGKSFDTIMGEWSYSILGAPEGEVKTGWHFAGYNPVRLEYDASGDPFVDYTPWLATQQNPNFDEVALTIGIPKSQLDGNGNGWSLDDPADYKIVLGPPLPNAGVGVMSSFNQFAASGYSYDVLAIPEPGTLALLTLGVAGLHAGRMRRRKQ